MANDAKDIAPKLGQKGDWRNWDRAIRQEADRLGLLQYLVNVVDNNVAAGIPVANNQQSENIRQKWRNFKDAILRSLKGSAKSFVDQRDVSALNAGQVVNLLRDDGNFNQNNRQEQRMKVKPLKDGKIKFHDKDQPADVPGFLSKVREIMNQSPTQYPPEAGALPGDEQNGALLVALPGLFCKSFRQTIERMQEEDGLTF